MPNSSDGCLAGLVFWTIDPWGNVRPCNHAPLICGNLLAQNVAEIVNGAELARWHNMIPAQCLNCAAYERCYGGCRAQAMLTNSPQDELIQEPLSVDPDEQRELTLPPDAYPVAQFTVRPESFGYLVIQGGNVLPVSEEARPLLQMLDGTMTLDEIQRQFGEAGLALVGALYRKGLIRFEAVDLRSEET